MSAFVVDDTNIDAILTGVTHWHDWDRGPLRWTRPLTELEVKRFELEPIDVIDGRPSRDLHWRVAEEIEALIRVELDPSPEGLCAVGRMVMAENLASYDYRYPLDDDATEQQRLDHIGNSMALAAAYRFDALPGDPDPVTIIKAIDCTTYQSCEHPGWWASEAKSFLHAARETAIDNLAGIDDAPWDISDRDVFRKLARV